MAGLRWSEISRFVGPSLRRSGDPLDGYLTSDDFRRVARRRVPRAVFDYVEGGAERELAKARNVRAFERVELMPHVLRDVATVDPATTVLGRPTAFPLVLGPTGFTRMMHAAGEPAVARAAARAGVPYALSTVGTTSLEQLPKLGDRWFQLYLWRDRGRSRALVERAAAAGFSTLVLTVDVAVQGARLRDTRNGLTIPPALTLRTMADMAQHPRWVWEHLTGEPLAFETHGSSKDDLAGMVNDVFEPALTARDVEWLRETWTGSLVVKGVQRVDDARAAVAAGADAVAVSNHGGRQLDRTPVPLELLPDVVDAVGAEAEVYLDGGARTGADVAAAVGLGARAVLVGRPYLYALMAEGERGVDHLLRLLLADYTRTLKLLGVTATDQLDRSLVRLRPA
jgi:L-lactate dehydrogenase (cytochrome)